MVILLMLSSIGVLSQEYEAQKIDSNHFKRWYQINDSIYRSEQPSKKGFKELESAGIKTILNLRRLRNDSVKAKGATWNYCTCL